MRPAAALQRVKCLGSAVVEGAFVAAGRMEAYCMLAMHPWDVAVGSLLVTEAGGKVTHLDGSDFDIEGKNALFSNGLLHAGMLDVLKLG
jgi:myo-inositol-1(or 4)-monophosphatase